MSELLNMDRRAMMAQIALLIGATALPVDALAAPGRKAKRFLPKAQFTLLSAVVDTIMPATDTPGALAALVPARIDGLLANWASAQTRTSINDALNRIEAAARAQKQKGFAALSAAERTAILTPHDAAALVRVAPPAGAPTANFFTQITYVADQGYFKLKELVLQLYYFSEVATTTELIYEHVPGKFEPSIKLTPASRPYLGTGPF